MKLPDIIGYPGKQLKSEYTDFDADSEYDTFVDDKIIIAELTPVLQTNDIPDANIYNPRDVWSSEYKKDLDGLGIKPPDNSTCLKVAISDLSPITRSYENRFGDSELLPTQNLLGPKIQELSQHLGFTNTAELEKELAKDPNSNFAKIVSGYNQALAMGANGAIAGGEKIGGRLGRSLSTIADTAQQILKAPGSKIGWPQMWKDCRFSQSYELSTRLYCFSTNNEDDYNNNIKACIGALELFVTPRSEKGLLYTAPYMLKFDIPGMIHMPIAYVSDMRIIEGGSEGDFAQTGRPNVVDITMSIQNAYNISVNVPKDGDTEYPYRPSVRKDLIGLAMGKSISKYTTSSQDKTSASDGDATVPPTSWEDAWNNANGDQTSSSKSSSQSGRQDSSKMDTALKGLNAGETEIQKNS